jgi:glyoxylase-like metal-dependent hydrolase (beta-lactamase superfamily II)
MTAPANTPPIAWRLVSDGAVAYPADLLFPGASPETLHEAGIGDELITPYHALLVTTGHRRILVDAGLGELAAEMGGTAGRLVSELRAAGVQPSDIADVLITHAHPDHVGGLTADGEPIFAHARHHITRAEHDFWAGPEPQDRLFAPMADFMVATARAALQTLSDAGLLDLCQAATELVPGVRLLNAPGHTPGHVAVELDNGGDTLVYLADAVLHELQFQHPDWTTPVDTDAVATVATRRLLLDHAAERGALVAGFHLARTGRLTSNGKAYSLTPAS